MKINHILEFDVNSDLIGFLPVQNMALQLITIVIWIRLWLIPAIDSEPHSFLLCKVISSFGMFLFPTFIVHPSGSVFQL